jgi:hypothetical protein
MLVALVGCSGGDPDRANDGVESDVQPENVFYNGRYCGQERWLVKVGTDSPTGIDYGGNSSWGPTTAGSGYTYATIATLNGYTNPYLNCGLSSNAGVPYRTGWYQTCSGTYGSTPMTGGTCTSDSQCGTASMIANFDVQCVTGPNGGCYSWVEEEQFRLNDVTLIQWKKEGGSSGDSDYHLVLQDGSGATMIAEIPDPGCIGANGGGSSPFAQAIANARSTFDSTFGAPTTSWSYGPYTVSVRGMGFYDFSHGQTGASSSQVEIHPVLGICYGGGCTP